LEFGRISQTNTYAKSMPIFYFVFFCVFEGVFSIFFFLDFYRVFSRVFFTRIFQKMLFFEVHSFFKKPSIMHFP